jgi:chromatin remodeling complex protein RSC6
LLYIKNKLIKHSIIKELKTSVIESILKQIVKDIADKKSKKEQPQKKDIKSTPLNDYLSTQFTIPDKTVVKPRQNKQVIGGFLHPTLISNELAIFLDKPIGTLMARTEVTRDINAYIRTNKLQDKVDGRTINADVKLSTLLKLKCGEELTYFNLQRFLSQHFISKNVEKEKEVVPVPAVPVPAVPVPAVPEPIIDVEPTQRRRPLPTSVRDCVWNHYIGEDINKHRCLCCKKVVINNRQFQVGHVISVRDGGTDEINNLRPICAPCNHSMGTKNMIEFVKTYGYYIG